MEGLLNAWYFILLHCRATKRLSGDLVKSSALCEHGGPVIYLLHESTLLYPTTASWARTLFPVALPYLQSTKMSNNHISRKPAWSSARHFRWGACPQFDKDTIAKVAVVFSERFSPTRSREGTDRLEKVCDERILKRSQPLSRLRRAMLTSCFSEMAGRFRPLNMVP